MAGIRWPIKFGFLRVWVDTCLFPVNFLVLRLVRWVGLSMDDKKDFHVNFSVRNSFLTLEQFVNWFTQVSPAMESLYISQDGGRYFWQSARKCVDCGSHFFQDNCDTVANQPKVACSKCGRLHDVQ